MIARAISRIIAPISCWSSTGNDATRPDRAPAPPMSRAASPKYRDSIARPRLMSQSDALDHTITAPHWPRSSDRAAPKSP
jgi:hypothetical protein